MGQHDGDRRLPVLRQGARRFPLGQSGAGVEAVAAPLRTEIQNADAGDSRRARLPRARDAGAAVLQHAKGARHRRAAGLLSRREPLDPEATELAALVPRILRLDQALRAGRAGAEDVTPMETWGETLGPRC